MRGRFLVLAVAVSALFAGPTLAGSTLTWILQSEDDLKDGEMTHVVLSSAGVLSHGTTWSSVDLSVPMAWSVLAAKDGAVWIGTGQDGRLLRVRGDAVEATLATEDFLVTALAADASGTVYAASAPAGRIYRVGADGALERFATVPSPYVWGLAVDAAGGVWAAGGTPASLYRVDAAGKVETVATVKDDHLRSLLLRPDGSLLVGTAGKGLLMEVRRHEGGWRTQVLHHFEEHEVVALAPFNGEVAIGVNKSAQGGATRAIQALIQALQQPPPAPGAGAAQPGQPQPPRPPPPSLQAGALYILASDGRIEKVHDFGNMPLHSLAPDGKGFVYAGTGAGGRVFRFDADGGRTMTADAAEEQVLGLLARGDGVALATTGNPGRLLRFQEPGAAATGEYTSKVLDARFPAKYGTLTWRGGSGLKFETRAGNVAEPDDTWSDWREIGPPQSLGGAVQSPRGRFFQFRAKWTDVSETLSRVTIAYLPDNQRTRIGKPEVGRPPSPPGQDPNPTPLRHVVWKEENPDGDSLRYWVHFRGLDGETWWPIAEEIEIKGGRYQWDTTPIPDGHYVVRVRVSDAASNPVDRALTFDRESDPFLVDNRKPEVRDLKATVGADRSVVVEGLAFDSFSRIVRIEYAVDGGSWAVVFPDDGILDSPTERFTIRPTDLEAGAHIVLVRVQDEDLNVGTAEASFTIR